MSNPISTQRHDDVLVVVPRLTVGLGPVGLDGGVGVVALQRRAGALAERGGGGSQAEREAGESEAAAHRTPPWTMWTRARPLRTRAAASRRFSGVMRLIVPRLSSGPQRPQFETVSK